MKRKVGKIILVVFLCACVAFVLVIIALNLMFPSEEIPDKENYSFEERDRKGNLVSSYQYAAGKENGYFFRREARRIVEGEYDRGVRVGRWTERYGDGSIRKDALYSDSFVVTNYRGVAEIQSRLVSRKDYRLDGTVIGSITNGTGVWTDMFDDGKHISEYWTVGYPTNYKVYFHLPGKNPGRGQSIASVTIAVDRDWPRGDYRVVISCYADDTGKIYSLDEGKNRMRRHEKGGAMILENRSMNTPPFFLGKRAYVIPSPSGGGLVYDTEISCSNETLVVRKILPGNIR